MGERSLLLHIVLKLALSMWLINPCVSHMPMAGPFEWDTSLVVSKGAFFIGGFDSLISRVMFHSTSFWDKPWRFGALMFFSSSSVLFQMLPFAYWTYNSMSSFGLTKQLLVFPFFISRLLWKIGDVGHRPPYLSHKKRERYHLCYFTVEEMGS